MQWRAAVDERGVNLRCASELVLSVQSSRLTEAFDGAVENECGGPAVEVTSVGRGEGSKEVER